MTPNPRPSEDQPPIVGHLGAQEQIMQLRADGATYRSIAAASGLAPSTVYDLASRSAQPNSNHHSRAAECRQPEAKPRPGRLGRDAAAAASSPRHGP